MIRVTSNRALSMGQVLLLPVFAALGVASTASEQRYVFGRADFATGNGPMAIVTGDFNGDGKPDLATANWADNTVSILLAQPDGTFSHEAEYAVGARHLPPWWWETSTATASWTWPSQIRIVPSTDTATPLTAAAAQ